jgi:hypothetical protein
LPAQPPAPARSSLLTEPGLILEVEGNPLVRVGEPGAHQRFGEHLF